MSDALISADHPLVVLKGEAEAFLKRVREFRGNVAGALADADRAVLLAEQAHQLAGRSAPTVGTPHSVLVHGSDDSPAHKQLDAGVKKLISEAEKVLAHISPPAAKEEPEAETK
jgi:hypothetical protein